MPLYPPVGLVKLAPDIAAGASGVMEVLVPAGYSDLEVSWQGRSDNAGSAGAGVRLTVESSPTSGAYDYEQLTGTAAVAAAAEFLGSVDFLTVGAVPTAGNTANLVASGRVWIPDYASANWKSMSALGCAAIDITTGTLITRTIAGIIELTGAIARIRLTLAAGNWIAGSKLTVSLRP